MVLKLARLLKNDTLCSEFESNPTDNKCYIKDRDITSSDCVVLPSMTNGTIKAISRVCSSFTSPDSSFTSEEEFRAYWKDLVSAPTI